MYIFGTADISEDILCRCAAYEDGKLTKVAPFARISSVKQFTFWPLSVPTGIDDLKLFFWKEGTQEPVCESRAIQ